MINTSNRLCQEIIYIHTIIKISMHTVCTLLYIYIYINTQVECTFSGSSSSHLQSIPFFKQTLSSSRLLGLK